MIKKTNGFFLSIGEAMIEMSEADGGLWHMGVAGDTLNTAWYVRSSLPARWSLEYFTRLGTDQASDRIFQFLQNRGIGAQWIARDPKLQPGLYMIELCEGERSFAYWRGQSAARHLADDTEVLASAIAAADILYFSGITLAILASEKRTAFLDLVQQAKSNGKTIVFDPNLRPRLWENAAAMQGTIMAAAASADIVLPSFEDEQGAFGDLDVEACARRYGGVGVAEVVVKNGGGPICLLRDGVASVISDFEKARPVDTTGAGDAFNGGYIAARIAGADCVAATQSAHALATKVIMSKGAMIDI